MSCIKQRSNSCHMRGQLNLESVERPSRASISSHHWEKMTRFRNPRKVQPRRVAGSLHLHFLNHRIAASLLLLRLLISLYVKYNALRIDYQPLKA